MKRWTIEIVNGKKVYHRFSNDKNGNFHWSGSLNGRNKDGKPVELTKDRGDIPNEIYSK